MLNGFTIAILIVVGEDLAAVHEVGGVGEVVSSVGDVDGVVSRLLVDLALEGGADEVEDLLSDAVELLVEVGAESVGELNVDSEEVVHLEG